MKIKEVSDTFNVPITALRYYEEKGLFNNVKRVNGIREYEDKDIQRLSLILSLKKTGLKINEIANYFKVDTNEANLNLLERQRKKLLDEVHQLHTSIDCVDYLIFKIKKEEF